MAASRLPLRTGGDAIDSRAVDQLLRCAQLSPDPAHTLEWALVTLRTHPVGRTDQVACQLVRAARARLNAAAPARRPQAPSLAWA